MDLNSFSVHINAILLILLQTMFELYKTNPELNKITPVHFSLIIL